MWRLVRGNVIVQSMVGTTLAGIVLGWLRHLADWGLTWGMGSLSTTFRVPSSAPGHLSLPGTLHHVVWRFMVTTPSLQMPVATAGFVEERSLSALQRFALMRKGLLAARPRSLVRYTVNPADLPVTARFQGITLVLTRDPKTMEITIRAPGRGRHDLVKAFLQHLADVSKDAEDDVADASGPPQPGAIGCPTVYRPVIPTKEDAAAHAVNWEAVRQLRARCRRTLHLPTGVLDNLLQDADLFFKSPEVYKDKEAPFRRGWCIHGPPGTGKSTLPAVVASELGGIPMCVLPMGMPGLTDPILDSLLHKAPVPSLIVLEDVDAALPATHVRKPAGVDGGGPGTGMPAVTLAGLLNALDGLGAHEGHLVILTTNHIGKLDPALLRAGRCDVTVKLPLAGRDQARSMFQAAFPDAGPSDVDQFQALVRAGKVSPATLSEFLMRVRGDMAAALDPAQVPGAAPVADVEPFTTGSLFHKLWVIGAEITFPWLLASAAFNLPTSNSIHSFMEKQSSTFCPLFEMDPHLRKTYVAVTGPALTTWEEVQEAFLDLFPGAFAEAKAFADAVHAYTLKHGWFAMCRLQRHLAMNRESPAAAVRSVDEWLLTFPRPGANLMPKWSLQFAAYFLGTHLTPFADTAGDTAGDASDVGGASSFFDTLQVACISDAQTLLRLASCGRATQLWEGLSKGPTARALQRVMNHVVPMGQPWSALHCADREVMAQAFVSAFEDQGVTFVDAMAAARRVTGPGGFSGFSRKVLAAIITSNATLEACIAVMLQDQVTYNFPACFVAS